MSHIELKAPAKINYGLRVLSKRTDGYHNLETIFYPIHDLFDTINLAIADQFTFTSDNENLGNDESNLIIRAKQLLENFINRRIHLKIHLQKRIPIGAGLGGGSSDAAATLIGINKLFDLKIKIAKLNELALTLGSDVPFFLYAKPAIGKSRGEILEPVDLHINYPILIVNPNLHISTKEAFDNISPVEHLNNIAELNFSSFEDFTEHKKFIQNDFEDGVFRKYPDIAQIKNTLYENGALFALMTGTGSSVFGIFKNIINAQKAKEKLRKDYFLFISNPHYKLN